MGKLADQYNETEIYILEDGWDDSVFGIAALSATREEIEDIDQAALHTHAAFERLLRLELLQLGDLLRADEAAAQGIDPEGYDMVFVPWPGGIEGMSTRLHELLTEPDAESRCGFWAVTTPEGKRIGDALLEEKGR
ncbi:hypothetical protein DW322_05025 [Rhodococcus rhodnii]|nr:hypothetical protein [Rhodococcus rhodnii]TXG92418.1 hypothetical protein DW322_05025 [Rhodococcus rhodnii]